MARAKHGMTGTPTYGTWLNMIARCRRHPDYAGRVTVCARWRQFAAFFADMGVRPDGCTLDRRDNDKGYEPGNCRWATQQEQANNRRPSTIKARRKLIRKLIRRQLEGKTND